MDVPAEDLQTNSSRSGFTVAVDQGGVAVITGFKLDYPGNHVLVDHALSRAERGLAGILHVDGVADPSIFDGKTMAGGGH